jgi:flagellar biosynthesis protein FliQ
MSFTQILIESLIVGLFIAVLVALLSYFILPGSPLPKVLLIGFLAGASGHLLLELLGLNKMYCKKGNACQ